jgi:hypothetical protein
MKRLDTSNTLTQEQRDHICKRIEALADRAQRIQFDVEKLGRRDMYWDGVTSGLNQAYKLVQDIFDDYCLFDTHEDLITPDIEDKREDDDE